MMVMCIESEDGQNDDGQNDDGQNDDGIEVEYEKH
jgi:hypothetical protein